MRRKSFSPLNFFSVLLWITLFISVTIFQAGCCRHQDKTNPGSVTWVALVVKFKPNTDGVGRDISIRAIEQLLIDSAIVLRAGKFPNFSPIFTTHTNYLDDSLEYSLIMSSPKRDTSISNPICMCKTNCGICATIGGFVHNPPDTAKNAPYQNILNISYRDVDIEQPSGLEK